MPTITTSQLYDYVPHRPPMIWVDELLEYSETVGRSRTRLDTGALYFSEEGVSPSAGIEFIAQTFAFNNAALLSETNANLRPDQRAFLAAVKNYHTSNWSSLKHGDELITTVTRLRQLGTISIIRGEIVCGERTVATAELKVFAN